MNQIFKIHLHLIKFYLRLKFYDIVELNSKDKSMEIFKGLADAGKCVILVSHSPEVASICDERYELKKKSR